MIKEIEQKIWKNIREQQTQTAKLSLGETMKFLTYEGS